MSGRGFPSKKNRAVRQQEYEPADADDLNVDPYYDATRERYLKPPENERASPRRMRELEKQALQQKFMQRYRQNLVSTFGLSLVNTLLFTPVARVQTIAQTQEFVDLGCKKFTGWDFGLVEATKYIYNKEGIVGFWRAGAANAVLVVTKTAVELLYVTAMGPYLGLVSTELGRLGLHALYSFTLSACMYPLEVAATKVSLDMGVESEGTSKQKCKYQYDGIYDCLSKLYSKGGIKALYSGFTFAVFANISHGLVARALTVGASLSMERIAQDRNTFLATWVAIRTIDSCVEYPLHVAKTVRMAKAADGEVSELDLLYQVVTSKNMWKQALFRNTILCISMLSTAFLDSLSISSDLVQAENQRKQTSRRRGRM